ncbi:hypothetical protein BDR05DRAFT_996549 [Suillus weaverae]|nr:hypothetical protein BDR05DRAFT_996549 [Suillus weaverae]
MSGDKKEVLQLQVEYGDFGSVQTETYRSQSVKWPRQSIAARLFGIGVVGLLLFVVFTHLGFNIFSNGLNEPGYPYPSDGAVVRCIGGTDWDEYYELPSWAQQFPFGSESLFTLPVGSDSLYFISRGVFQYDTVTVEQSTEASNNVIVHVRAAYFKEEAFERANTSKSSLPGQNNKDQLMFDVTLTLPASTSAPLFRHEVAALADTAFFGSISSTILHFPINFQSVAAETGIFTTANGLIKGHFHSTSTVTSSLKLTIIDMAVDADVDLFHNEFAKPSELVMTTANA